MRFVNRLAALLAAVVLGATVAAAADLDTYRSQGVIAERYDGYVELRVDDAPAEARQLVERVNAKRRDIYEKRADRQDVEVEAVGKVYAKQILKKAPSGTYVKTSDGGYRRIP